MAKQLPSINVVPRVPLWLAETEEELSIAIQLISPAYEVLLKNSKLGEPKTEDLPGFYSNKILAETVNKISECKELLSRMQLEVKDCNERSLSYRKSYDQQRFQSMQKMAEISEQRQKLVLHLMDWQQIALKKFHEAEIKFNEMQQKSAKMKIKLNKKVAAEAFKCFIKDFGDVATFLYDEEDNVVGVIGVSRIYEDFHKSSSAELKRIAELIKEKSLIQMATDYVEAEAAAQKNYHDFYTIQPTWLKKVDRVAHNDMIKQANELTVKYNEAAAKLSKESHEFYEALDKRERQLRINMLAANKAIRSARLKFEEFYDSIVDPTVNDCRIIISVYEEYEKTVDVAMTEYEKFQSQFWAVKAEYKQGGEKFGVYREETVDHLEYQVNEKLYRNINKAHATQLYRTTEILEYKSRIAQEDLLHLIKNAIANNVKFWHEQTGLFGSSTKIGKISVPKGIAQIYNKDCKEHSTTQATLLAIKKTIGDRIAYGAGSWYARRNLSTTDFVYAKLFKLLNNIEILTSEEVTELKNRFSKMGMVELDPPAFVNYRHDKAELSHRHSGQEITMKESDFLGSDKPN